MGHGLPLVEQGLGDAHDAFSVVAPNSGNIALVAFDTCRSTLLGARRATRHREKNRGQNVAAYRAGRLEIF